MNEMRSEGLPDAECMSAMIKSCNVEHAVFYDLQQKVGREPSVASTLNACAAYLCGTLCLYKCRRMCMCVCVDDACACICIGI